MIVLIKLDKVDFYGIGSSEVRKIVYLVKFSTKQFVYNYHLQTELKTAPVVSLSNDWWMGLKHKECFLYESTYSIVLLLENTGKFE